MASKSRRNKVKFKLTKELIILVVALVAILVATIIMGLPSNEAKKLDEYNGKITAFNNANQTSHQLLSEGHVFKEISYNSLTKKKNNDDYTYVLYGTFDQESFVSILSTLNYQAKEYEIDTIYLFLATWVAEQEDTDSIDFNKEVNEKNAVLNENKDKDQNEFDMADIDTATLLVFKDGSLVFNTQTYDESAEYTWNNYINKALTLGVDSDNE
ncbi:MAG: hypothetical protein IJA65_01615 [Acholeplasmatales bacterium]|nr:hypothetical protein [Acholeplasmatales bacterium]